jgi:hypothetical protein
VRDDQRNEINYEAVYLHARKLLDASLLTSPLPLETVQSMYLFAAWNLVSNKDAGHIDSWLLSGMAIMHGMLGTNFHELMNNQDSKETLEAIQTWNLICLCHLQ